MKTFVHLTMLALLALPLASQAAESCPELLNHAFKRLPSGKAENLCQYRGKVILVWSTRPRAAASPRNSTDCRRSTSSTRSRLRR